MKDGLINKISSEDQSMLKNEALQRFRGKVPLFKMNGNKVWNNK